MSSKVCLKFYVSTLKTRKHIWVNKWIQHFPIIKLHEGQTFGSLRELLVEKNKWLQANNSFVFAQRIAKMFEQTWKFCNVCLVKIDPAFHRRLVVADVVIGFRLTDGNYIEKAFHQFIQKLLLISFSVELVEGSRTLASVLFSFQHLKSLENIHLALSNALVRFPTSIRQTYTQITTTFIELCQACTTQKARRAKLST